MTSLKADVELRPEAGAVLGRRKDWMMASFVRLTVGRKSLAFGAPIPARRCGAFDLLVVFAASALASFLERPLALFGHGSA